MKIKIQKYQHKFADLVNLTILPPNGQYFDVFLNDYFRLS